MSRNSDKVVNGRRLKPDLDNPCCVTAIEKRFSASAGSFYFLVRFTKFTSLLHAVRFRITYYTAFGDKLGCLPDTDLSDIEIYGRDFETAVPAPENAEDIEVSLVSFIVSGVEINYKPGGVTEYPFRPFEKSSTAKAFRSIIRSAVGYPAASGRFWVCACGNVNFNSENRCLGCGANKTDVFAAAEKVSAAERPKTAEDLAREAKARAGRKRLKKWFAAGAAVLAALIIAGLGVGFLAPFGKIKQGGVTYRKNDGEYVVIAFDDSAAELEIPDKVRGVKVVAIDNGAFSYKENLKKIVLGENIRYIDRESFRNCYALMTVTMPDSLIEIAYSAFEGCRRLSTVKLSQKLDVIGSRAFCGCVSLKKITIFPEISKIGAGAFDNPELNVIFKGTEKQWANVKKVSAFSNKTTFTFASDLS